MTTRMVDVLKADYEARCRREVRVPWADQPVYFDPITVSEMAEAQARGASSSEHNVNLLIKKAKDAEGNPLFTAGDRIWLLEKASFDRLADLIDGMFGGVLSAEQAAAVAANPPSSSA